MSGVTYRFSMWTGPGAAENVTTNLVASRQGGQEVVACGVERVIVDVTAADLGDAEADLFDWRRRAGYGPSYPGPIRFMFKRNDGGSNGPQA